MISKLLYAIITIEKVGVIMQTSFLIDREKTNKLEISTYKYAYCLPEFHSQIEIFGVISGETEMFIDGKQKTLTNNSFAVILPYTIHEFKWRKPSPSFHIIIPTSLCQDFLKKIEGKKLENPFFENPELFNKIKQLFDLMNEKDASDIRKTGIANTILGYILENSNFINRKTQIDTELLNKILIYIDENFNKDIFPKAIAEHFGFTQSFISHYFKTYCGISLKKFITLRRLRNAIALMLKTNNKLTYCAFESGFTSMRTFYRSFQEEFGCSPKAYIKNLK